MSLTPCKFFAQGNCRYGNNCRFYHDARLQGQTGMFGNRPLAPATFQPGGGGFNQQGALNLSAKSSQNLDIIVEGVKKDMQEWQMSKIWPYSCYGPVGGKACIPGFEDISPEEFRLAFMQNGNVLPPEMGQRFQQIHQLRLNYQQATVENRNTIERIATSTNVTQSPFGGQPTNPQIGQAGIFKSPSVQQTGSIFGGAGAFATQQPAQGAASIFGGTSFGTTPTTSTFGQPATLGNVFQTQSQPQPSGIFGGQQTPAQSTFGSTFQTPQQSSSLFQSAQQQQSGLFQNQTNTTTLGTGSFFQQPTSQPQGNLFQQQPSQPTSGLFQQPQLQLQQPTLQSQQPPTGLFQSPQPQQQPAQTNVSLFNQPQPSLFAPPAATSSIFGGNAGQQQPATMTSSSSIFGGSMNSAAVGNAPQQFGAQFASVSAQKYVYSIESELSPEELESFKAGEFTIDSLPTKPPPQSLCL